MPAGRIAILGIFAVGSGIVIGVRARRTRAAIRERWADRPALDPVAFARARFPPEQREAAQRARRILARHSKIPLDRMLPEDRPILDLEMDNLDRGSSYRFVLELEDAFGVPLDDHFLDGEATFREFVEAMYRPPIPTNTEHAS